MNRTALLIGNGSNKLNFLIPSILQAPLGERCLPSPFAWVLSVAGLGSLAFPSYVVCLLKWKAVLSQTRAKVDQLERVLLTAALYRAGIVMVFVAIACWPVSCIIVQAEPFRSKHKRPTVEPFSQK